jgi:hypothetical protein
MCDPPITAPIDNAGAVTFGPLARKALNSLCLQFVSSIRC